MLREVAGEGQDLIDQRFQPRNRGVGDVQPGFGHAGLGHVVTPVSPYGGGEPGSHVFGQAQYFADLAEGAARAIVNDGGRDTGAFAAIAGIDILHDLLAALMLEIHVDVGRFVARFGQEA